ncbi:PTS sugar transporter subunit IIA [Sporanaerobium hydrogeniformans]|uniref:PTS sugar transporter subunit IIA n=1 Tax=Sporanaerobium hydrogeniformans TaxID=3072179 RepID=A0AC61DE63_9FIRM|nr:HPr family phosphocarrier protein [Sporanaerobium hydrogeniformans]PHV71564.1 PTS sugar transporter subunit IIA [Sporanaerobium hydrogeniformans]
MKNQTIKLELKNGLEARPAALFVQIASKYESHITVVVNEKQVNAKSIMGMMSLGTIKGEKIEIIAEGEDENEAVAALIQFLTQQEVSE